MGEAASELKVVPHRVIDVGGYALLPDGVRVQAQCVKLETAIFTFGKDKRTGEVNPQRKRILTFRVILPLELSCYPEDKRPVELQMFVREEQRWKRPPVRSKLLKVLKVLQDGKLSPRVKRITKQLVEGKIFLCKVKTVRPKDKDSPLDAYSEIEMIEKKL